MNAFRFIAFVVILFSMACAAPVSDEGADLVALSDSWQAALNADDLDALVALYADDVRLMPPHEEMGQGIEAVRAAFGAMIDAGLGGRLDSLEARTAGDIGYNVGTYVLETEDGTAVDHGKFIEVWRRVDGSWRIANDIWNSDLPATPPTATLMLHHEVAEPEVWLAAWRGPDGRKELFAQHGVPSVRVFQSPDDPNLTGLLVEVADMAAFQAMLASEEGMAAAKADTVVVETIRSLAEVP